MGAEKISRIKLELTHLFEQQVEYFRKRNVGEPAAERREYEKRRERIRQLFAELSGLKKAA
ncbi:MAG TPA: hypothetical protein VGV15_00425 [Terriglobales bacterium]|nr:hypothetical protein [Terriglobales bacterium]